MTSAGMASAPPRMLAQPGNTQGSPASPAMMTLPPSGSGATMSPSNAGMTPPRTMAPSSMSSLPAGRMAPSNVSLEPKEIHITAGTPVLSSHIKQTHDAPAAHSEKKPTKTAIQGIMTTHTSMERLGGHSLDETLKATPMASKQKLASKHAVKVGVDPKSSMVECHAPPATMPPLGQKHKQGAASSQHLDPNASIQHLHPATALALGQPAEEIRLGDNFSVQITRLLDMPCATRLLGGNKPYVVRVLDSKSNKCLAQTQAIPSQTPKVETETVNVEGQLGLLKLTTSHKLIYVQVEHEGAAFAANSMIGRLHVHRLDERSARIWPYALELESGAPANCGIELQVLESAVPREYLATMEKIPQKVLAETRDDVVAIIDVDKILDLPQPMKVMSKPAVLVIIEAADPGWEEKELQRLGPFPLQEEMSDSRLRMCFCRTSNHGSAEMVQSAVCAPFHVGGEALEGAMNIRFHVYYCELGKSQEHRDSVGITDPIRVFFYESPMQYCEIRPRGGSTAVGGIHLRHRLGNPGQVKRQAMPKAGPKPPPPILTGAGGYPPGSEEERLFRACMNSQAQTRAAQQRIKMQNHEAKTELDESGKMWMENGYRNWTDMDGLFATMGPHPIMGSSHVGPGVVRGYEEQHQAVKEVERSLDEWDRTHPRGQKTAGINKATGKKTIAQQKADEEMAETLAQWMCYENPHEIEHVVRPMLCKDPQEIMEAKDMSWCPDAPMYVPVDAFNARDRETLRLAQFDPHQNAKLSFLDVAPNYRVEDDIWGMAHKARQAKAKGMARRPGGQRKVRDDCPIA